MSSKLSFDGAMVFYWQNH